MRKIVLLLQLCFLFICTAESQSCIPTTINGTVLGLSCGQPCTSFTYQVPHLKSTTDYLVNPVPYAAFSNNSGTTIPAVYIDDKFSPLIPMAFPFCFYGLNYNNIVVGSNSIVTFEALCANANNAYTLSVAGAAQPIPYAGGAGPSGIGTTYYPRTAIMGAYQDIEPVASPPSPNRIEYNVFGTAPCRKFVISFVNVRLFQCTTIFQTSQIVLYESTGLIDVYLGNKPTCPTWPGGSVGGLAILGIQDETRTKARAAPGKNCTQWTEANTGYRFTPNGGTSNFVSAQLFTLSGTFLANGDTATTTPGLLDITFPNICPPNNPSTQYVIRTTFNSCTGVPLTSSDTITYNRINSLPATITMNPTTCGASVGSVTVTPSSGTSPYTYVLNGGVPVTAPGPYTFTNLPAGPYTVVITDATGCTNTLNITVTTNSTIPGSATFTATSCPLSPDGTITVTPGGGTAPYQFSLDGGPLQASNIFTAVLAGPHTVNFTDAGGCSGTVSVTVTAGNTPVTANVNATATSCPGVNNGTITVTPTSGTPAYQYSLDGGAFQGSNTFTNVSIGAHTITVKDAYGCTGSFPINVAAGPTLTANVNSTATSCPAVANGTITATATNGTAPYQYSLDGGAFQLSNTFTNVAAGAHSVTITDANGCSNTFPVNVAAGPALTATVSSTATSCSVSSDGTVTATPTNGTAPYQYALDGGPFQPGNTFTNVAAGPHNVTVRDTNGCTNTFPINVATGSALTSTISGNDPPCSNLNNGTITVTPTSGTAPYQYSLNGGAPQASNVFNGLPPGPYTVDFTDVNGCTGTNSITLTTNTAITATSTLVMPLCNANANGSITINASGGVPPYQYSKNGGLTYQASPTFGGLIAGTYTFRVKDAVGCLYDFTFMLSEPPVLTVSSVSTTATCRNNDGSITITAGGGTPAYTYSINGGANYSPSNSFIDLPIGLYNVIVKDANGCKAAITENVLLNDTMRLSLGPDSTICFGSSLVLMPQTNLLTDTFRWRPSAGLDYDTAKNPVATPNDTTQYILHAKWGVCQREDTIIINVLHKPVAHAGRDTSICYKTFALLNGSATNLSGPVSYAWTPAANVIPASFPIAVATPDSTQLYILTVTDNYGCSFTGRDSILVTMQPPVPAFAGNDTNAVIGQPHQLRASGGTQYLWSPAGPLNNALLQNPLATMYTDTYFRVLVTDAIGCTATDDVFIKVYPGPTYHVPNAFSPNGDGLNDIFRPIPAGMATTTYFMVYNRYGELIFQTREWLKGWDGKYKGKDAPMGTYVWIIKGLDNNGKVLQMKGTVMLLR